MLTVLEAGKHKYNQRSKSHWPLPLQEAYSIHRQDTAVRKPARDFWLQGPQDWLFWKHPVLSFRVNDGSNIPSPHNQDNLLSCPCIYSLWILLSILRKQVQLFLPYRLPANPSNPSSPHLWKLFQDRCKYFQIFWVYGADGHGRNLSIPSGFAGWGNAQISWWK